MGLFNTKKLVGTVKIKFYGEDKALVTYNKTDVVTSEFVEHSKIELFVMYYAKMLYNLGKGEHADLLIENVEKVATESIKSALVKNQKTGEFGIVKSEVKRQNILGTNQKLVSSELGNETKTYTGELHQKPDGSLIIQTQMDRGEEVYYAPISVIMFLQHLTNFLPEIMLAYLMLAINFMNKYYREIGNYSNVRSIIDAPSFGIDSATHLLNLNE